MQDLYLDRTAEFCEYKVEQITPRDETLLAKIARGQDSYLNLDTGRFVSPTTAATKSYYDHEIKICGTNQGQFERIKKKAATQPLKKKKSHYSVVLSRVPSRPPLRTRPLIAHGRHVTS